jgi:DNA polymerase III subunit epsilon
MREIIFDTETTGLDNKEDRIIEIGGIELERHIPTGRTFHVYINPGAKTVHPDALAVHGITDEFLKEKPGFHEIVEDLLAFFDGAHWIAHNANFDMGFINAELQRLDRPPIPNTLVIDTLALARRKHPMGPNSLDALCRRYGIDNSHRAKHGALLDSELLAEVYIEMIGGKQAALGLAGPERGDNGSDTNDGGDFVLRRERPLPSRLTEGEKQAHQALVSKMGQKAIWLKYGNSEDSGA